MSEPKAGPTPDKRSSPIRDPEIRSLRTCAREMEKYDKPTQLRMLRWLTRKYGYEA